MTLSQWSEEYVRLRQLAVKAAYNGDAMLMVKVGDALQALPSFHYEHKKEE